MRPESAIAVSVRQVMRKGASINLLFGLMRLRLAACENPVVTKSSKPFFFRGTTSFSRKKFVSKAINYQTQLNSNQVEICCQAY